MTIAALTATMRSSLIQAFDEHGKGLVLRGHDFDWDPDKTGSKPPHLTADDASSLMIRVLDQHEQYMRQTRTRVVAHKTSRYWPGQRDGFRAAIESRVHRNGPSEDHAPGSRRLPGRLPLRRQPPGSRLAIQ